MSRILMTFWAYLLSWICSAVVHVADADVGGIQGLQDPAVLLSVSIVAFLVFVPVMICCAAYLRGRWVGFSRTVAVFAFGLGLLVVVLGFGGRSATAWALGFLGMSAMIALVLLAAALPIVLHERARGHRESARTPMSALSAR